VLKDFRWGFLSTLPAGLSVIAYSIVLGILALEQGLSLPQLLLMDVGVFAGSAQFVMVQMWQTPLSIFSMALSAAVINLRYFVIGASLFPLFNTEPLWRRLVMIHFVTDESWAVTMAHSRRNPVKATFLIGGGTCIMLVGLAGTLVGYALGVVIPIFPSILSDFTFIGVFAGLALSLWRGKGDLLPWCVAAVVATLVHRLIAGNWHILIGGVVGALTGVLVSERRSPS